MRRVSGEEQERGGSLPLGLPGLQAARGVRHRGGERARCGEDPGPAVRRAPARRTRLPVRWHHLRVHRHRRLLDVRPRHGAARRSRRRRLGRLVPRGSLPQERRHVRAPRAEPRPLPEAG